jgi:hypothetical protein
VTTWFGASVKAADGSDGCADAPAGWKTRRPLLVEVPGLSSWMEVRKNDPKFPGSDPTTGM